MDLGKVLDATEPIDCVFMDHKITAHMYTAGVNRLTKEEREALQSVNDVEDQDGVTSLRIILPMVLGGWDLDGEPMEYQGAMFPPTKDNVAKCPDALLIAVGNPVLDKWQKANPTNGGQPPTGSQPEDKPEPSPAENTLP